MKIKDVPAYLDTEHDVEVTRQTVYNWAKTGKLGATLKTVRKGGQLWTTKGWVDEFVASSLS